MPRKKKTVADEAPLETTTAIVVAEPESKPELPTPVTAYIHEPQAVADAPAEGPINPDAKNWGDPYKVIFSSTQNGFEMGENRRFKQRVFRFAEKPDAEVIAKLKDNGFTYRAGEKAWTIQANPDTRKLSDELAREFVGQTEGLFPLMHGPEFFRRFADAQEIGRDITDTEVCVFYDTGTEVGVWRHDRGTTIGSGSVLGPDDAEMARHWFRENARKEDGRRWTGGMPGTPAGRQR